MKTEKPLHSLNPTLNALRIANLESEFVTVSPVTGVGDYTTIYDALNSGAAYIFVKSGTYAETHDLVLSGQNLIGESPKTTVVQLVNNSIEFETHDATNAYDTGTAQVVNNSTTVNGGGGTLWDTGANAPSGYTDPWLIIRGMAIPIAGFVNDTTLTLKEEYRGTTQTGNYYIIDAINIGCLFTGFTVEHTPVIARACLVVSGIGVTIERNILKCSRLTTTIGIQTGVNTNSVAAKTVIQNNSILSGGIGIELKNSHSAEVRGNVLSDQNDHAIRTNTDDHDAWGNRIMGNNIFGSTNTAIELDTGSEGTIIQGNHALVCRGSIITMDDCDHCVIENNAWEGVTTVDSVIFTTTCEYAVVRGNYSAPHDWTLSCGHCMVSDNMLADGSIHVTGDNNSLNGNHFTEGQITITGDYGQANNNFFLYAIADYGVRLNGTSGVANGNYMKDVETSGVGLDGGGGHGCVGNNIRSALGNGIDCLAPDCVVDGNVIHSVTVYGIETDPTANFCVITNNRIVSSAGSVGIHHCGQGGVIEDNYISGCSGHGIQIVSVGAGQGDEMSVCGNKIFTCNVGIYADSDDGLSKVDGNLIDTTTLAGIQITGIGAHNWSVNNNLIKGAGTIGILFDNGGKFSTINGNVIETPGSHGIHLHSGEADFHASIVGNTIHSAGGSGIFLDREGQATGNRNDHCIITGNSVNNSSGDGILCETLRGVISNNRCDDGTGDGICVRCGDQSIVEGNGCDNNGASGIDVENTADRIVVTSNICLNNAVNQIVNNGTNTVAANNIVA